VDGVTVRAFEREAQVQIHRLAEEIATRRYRPGPLRRVWVPKCGKEDEYRAVAIPAVRDRVAAGAAHQVLEHVFEPRFHDCSFGFRRSRGTLAALRRVLRLRDEGMRWVARADVNQFFDRVDQHRLFAQLRDVVPWPVRRLLLLWTRTWVHDGADRFRLTRGVPQGTPTSPLLANFYLTPFDEHLEFEGVRVVRYVDDLVALASTEHEARNALAAMRAGLASLGLELNAHADPVRSFDQGFEFLGFHLIGRSIRVAPSKLLEFRRHATHVLESPRAGSMRRRIALLNRMIRGWRAYYHAGVPRDQFRELDDWLEEQVRAARLRLWAREQPGPRSLELAGLESLSAPGRRVFQPPAPPSVEGYAYRLPVEGEDDRRRVAAVHAGECLTAGNGRCSVRRTGEPPVPLDDELRAVVVADGALCEAAALRRLLERGTALRFVATIAPDPPA
jgi:RNA-directed DNA polymerase